MKKVLAIVLTVAALVLEILPYGAVLRFANPDPSQVVSTKYSYFDPILYGYANVGPMLTGILTIAILGLLIVYCLRGKGRLPLQIVTVIAAFTSLLPVLMFGILYVTIIGVCITVLLAGVCALTFTMKKKTE